jgi:hypothetical protein
MRCQISVPACRSPRSRTRHVSGRPAWGLSASSVSLVGKPGHNLWRQLAGEKPANAVAAMLDAATFITVPLCTRVLAGGRLYLAACKHGTFETSDVAFLLQVIEYTMPVLHNIVTC